MKDLFIDFREKNGERDGQTDRQTDIDVPEKH